MATGLKTRVSASNTTIPVGSGGIGDATGVTTSNRITIVGITQQELLDQFIDIPEQERYIYFDTTSDVRKVTGLGDLAGETTQYIFVDEPPSANFTLENYTVIRANLFGFQVLDNENKNIVLDINASEMGIMPVLPAYYLDVSEYAEGVTITEQTRRAY